MAADEQERKKWLWILTLSAEPYIIIYYYGEFDQMPWRKMIKKNTHCLFMELSMIQEEHQWGFRSELKLTNTIHRCDTSFIFVSDVPVFSYLNEHRLSPLSPGILMDICWQTKARWWKVLEMHAVSQECFVHQIFLEIFACISVNSPLLI